MDESVMVAPADEEERACFGEILPLPPLQSRRVRCRKIVETIDEVAAGKERFVTPEEVLQNFDDSFDSAMPVLRIPRVNSNTQRIMSALCRKMGSLSFDEREMIEKQYIDNLILSKKHYEENRDTLFSHIPYATAPHVGGGRSSRGTSSNTSQLVSRTPYDLVTDSRYSTQSSLLSCPLPTINSWSASNDSLSSLTYGGTGMGDFPENFVVEGDDSSSSPEEDLSLTPPPPRKQRAYHESIAAKDVTISSRTGEDYRAGKSMDRSTNCGNTNVPLKEQKPKRRQTSRVQLRKRKPNNTENVPEERLRPVLPRKAKQNKNEGCYRLA